MELPTARELELEMLSREKDSQLAELTDEISALRQYLSKQPGPSTTEPVTLPPPLVSVLLPHIGLPNTAASSSSTVAAGVNQRMRQLQEENDELYNLLKQSETGKLKDETRGLRRAVTKLEGALKESHQVIISLSTELDKAYETLMTTSRQVGTANDSTKSHSYSQSPRNSYHPTARSDSAGDGTNPSKAPPTGPRGYKRPRLSDSQASPLPRPAPSLPQKPQTNIHAQNHNHSNAPHRTVEIRDQGRQPVDNRSRPNLKMDVDDDRQRIPSPANRERDRIRERERNNKEREQRERSIKEREKERERGREWDRDANKSNSNPRRNGNYSGAPGRGGGGGPGPGRKGNDRSTTGSNNRISEHASRTLQERLGL